jgi:hypothetical protein
MVPAILPVIIREAVHKETIRRVRVKCHAHGTVLGAMAGSGAEYRVTAGNIAVKRFGYEMNIHAALPISCRMVTTECRT